MKKISTFSVSTVKKTTSQITDTPYTNSIQVQFSNLEKKKNIIFKKKTSFSTRSTQVEFLQKKEIISTATSMTIRSLYSVPTSCSHILPLNITLKYSFLI